MWESTALCRAGAKQNSLGRHGIGYNRQLVFAAAAFNCLAAATIKILRRQLYLPSIAYSQYVNILIGGYRL